MMKTILISLLILLSAASSADSPEIETLDNAGFNQVLVRTGDLYIAGQPSEAGLQQLQTSGVTTVVNLRTNHEMDNREVVPFDEAAAVKSLGMDYVHIPSGGPDTPYSPEMLNRFAQTLEQAEGKVLLHCTVAWRASHLYTAYLTRYQGLSLEDAQRVGQLINLGTLPLAGFLGEKLEIVIAPDHKD
jgi:uncharacterized protein (TIGR01244 family)